jgi:hypothetical protein
MYESGSFYYNLIKTFSMFNLVNYSRNQKPIGSSTHTNQTHFEKKLAVENNGTLNFSFMRVNTVYGLRYFISVIDKHKTPHHFKMYNEEGRWIIVNPEILPKSITRLEPEFEKAILNHQGFDWLVNRY